MVEILWEYLNILFLTKYSPNGFNIYPINYYDHCQMAISKSVIPSTFVIWCLFYSKGFSPLLRLVNITIYQYGITDSHFNKWWHFTNVPVLRLRYLAGGWPIQAGLWVLLVRSASCLLSDTSCHRFIFTFWPLVLTFSKELQFLSVENGI